MGGLYPPRHQRHHRHLNMKDFLAGTENRMANDANRQLKLTNHEFLTHFRALWTPSQPFYSVVISAWQLQTSPLDLFLHAPPPLTDTGPPGASTAAPSIWILPWKLEECEDFIPFLQVFTRQYQLGTIAPNGDKCQS